MIRILLLGETGVGKSTWINAFANYLKYDTFENAFLAPLISLIPSKFSITDSNYNEQIIKIGESINETFTDGESSTQKVKEHIINFDDKVIKIIDTPGIGDTRGAEKDSENLANILSHISQYKELHGICILLKPNSSRLTVLFKYCINELLTHLHKSAAQNIVFCFTNARSTFYRPGDTFTLLKNIVNEMKDCKTNIPLGNNNIYCVDNEGFRYLCCLQNGIKFSDSEKEIYKYSWEKSAEEIQRMVKKLGTWKPHWLKDTVSLFEARKVILRLSEQQSIWNKECDDCNIVIEELHKNIREILQEIQQLSHQALTYDNYVVKQTQNYFTTVCTNIKCIETHVSERTGTSTTIYKTRCHERCFCAPQSIPERAPSLALQRCMVMNQSLFCNRCGCSWSLHMHIQYKQKFEKLAFINRSVQQQLASNNLKQMELESNLKDATEKYFLTKQKINDCINIGAQLAEAIKIHSLLPYNDAKEDYLKMNIIEAERETNKELAQRYKIQLENHKKEKSIFFKYFQQPLPTIMSSNEIITAIKKVMPFGKYVFDENLLKYIFTKKAFQQPNITFMRLSLFDQLQKEDESNSNFLSLIYQSTKECEFDGMEDIKQEMAILFFIHGLKNEGLKKHLFSLPEMPKTINEIRTIVNDYDKISNDPVAGIMNHNQLSTNAEKNKTDMNEKIVVRKSKNRCWHCGSQKHHKFTECSAKNMICKRCNKKGHIEIACRRR